MGKYSEYGKKLDDLARQRFADYEKARDIYTKAKKAHSDFPVRTGWGVTIDDQLKARKLEIDFLKAEADFKEAQKVYKSAEKEINQIREELYNKLTADLTMRAEELDQNVVKLLETGVCKAQDIHDLYSQAKNVTTKRYIANFAKSQIKDRMKSEDRITLTNITQNIPALEDPNQTEAMQIFDSMTEVFHRCVNNDAMIGYWGEFTEGPISEM